MSLFKANEPRMNMVMLLFWGACFSISIAKNVFYTLSYGNTNLEITSEALAELQGCGRIAPYSNSPREYTLASNQISVFSGFKPFNTLRRHTFYQQLLNPNRNWPVHHLELHGAASDFNFEWLRVGNVCKLISTQPLQDQVDFEETVIRGGLQRQLDGIGLKFLYDLVGVDFVQSQDLFIYDLAAVPKMYVPTKIQTTSDLQEVTELMKEQSDSVMSGELSVVEIGIDQERIDLFHNVPASAGKVPEDENLSYTDSGYRIDVNDFSGFLVVTSETYSNTQVYCENTPSDTLDSYHVNLIQTGIVVPENCVSMRIDF